MKTADFRRQKLRACYTVQVPSICGLWTTVHANAHTPPYHKARL